VTARGLIPVDYRDGDVALQGLLALPAGDGPHPGVLVMHNALGMGVQSTARAEMLAELGFAALCADMYGTEVRGISSEVAGQHMIKLVEDPALLRARANAGLAALGSHPAVDGDKLAAIGFCFGGMCVLELARSGADVKATVSYHGLLQTKAPAEAGAINGIVSVYTGASDPYVPAADVAALRAEMTAAGADWTITEYGRGYHSFMGPDFDHGPHAQGIKYDPLLDDLSWASTVTLLNATLRDGAGATAPVSAH
jgi:dienelactone hydrolase